MDWVSTDKCLKSYGKCKGARLEVIQVDEERQAVTGVTQVKWRSADDPGRAALATASRFTDLHNEKDNTSDRG